MYSKKTYSEIKFYVWIKMTQDLNNKKIELFADNGIDNYRKDDSISIGKMIEIYLANDAFFVLGKDSVTDGYLDLADLDQIKKLVEGIKNNQIKREDKIKDLKNEWRLTFRNEFVDSNEKLSDVIDKINGSQQKYFPVIKSKVLIGRVSKEIIRKKINELY
jgi:hypothetical protein